MGRKGPRAKTKIVLKSEQRRTTWQHAQFKIPNFVKIRITLPEDIVNPIKMVPSGVRFYLPELLKRRAVKKKPIVAIQGRKGGHWCLLVVDPSSPFLELPCKLPHQNIKIIYASILIHKSMHYILCGTYTCISFACHI